MRIALLGPCAKNRGDLRHAAAFVLETANADRAVYLGGDEALDEVVDEWAAEIVHGDAGPRGIWDRTLALLRPDVGAAEIRETLAREQELEPLRRLEQLPRGKGRSLELFGNRVAILVDDRERLDEDDLATAEIVVYGKSPEARVRRIGTRWFLSPGAMGGDFGVLLLEETDRELRATFHDPSGRLRGSETLTKAQGAKVKVRDGRDGEGGASP